MAINERKLRKSRRSTRSKRRRSRSLPRTAKLSNKRTEQRPKFSRASTKMDIVDLQFMAKSKGIPWMGVSKTRLIQKINAYD